MLRQINDVCGTVAKQDLTRINASVGFGKQLHDGHGCNALSTAAFAYHSENSFLSNVKGDTIDSLYQPFVRREMRVQITDPKRTFSAKVLLLP